MTEEVTPEIQKAYDDLIASFANFMECFGKANEVGIDAGAAISQNLKAMVPAEDWDAMPSYVRMALG